MRKKHDTIYSVGGALLLAAFCGNGLPAIAGQSGSQAKPARRAGLKSAARAKTIGSANNEPGTVQLSRKALLDAARAGGDYLVRMQQPDGRFYYWYDPATDRVDATQYNILRHSGAALSLFDLYAATDDRRYLGAARRATAFLRTRFRMAAAVNDVPEVSGEVSRQVSFHSNDNVAGPPLYVLDFDNKVKLGANGLALLVLVRQFYSDSDVVDLEAAAGLAEMILKLQRPDGGFESYYSLRGHEPSGDLSLYYPGEAILGLLNLYNVTGEKRLLDAARRGADYLIYSQRRMKHLPPDAWLMQALEMLHNYDIDSAASERPRRCAAHLLALAEAMIRDQYDDNAPAGYAGGFAPGVPRSTPAASRAEGLVAAYRVAIASGDLRSAAIADALRSSARFQLSQQLGEKRAARISNPERARGGFRESLTSQRVRIDFVQHNVCSLLQIGLTIF